MGRFETRWLAADKNLSALADLSGHWIGKVHGRRPSRGVVLKMDSSVSPIHGEQEMERLERQRAGPPRNVSTSHGGKTTTFQTCQSLAIDAASIATRRSSGEVPFR
jgi:hypothetical protein